MERSGGDPKPLTDILGGITRRLERERVAQGDLQGRWTRAAGEHAEGTRATGLRAGILWVEVDAPPRLAELSAFMKHELLTRLQADGGEAVRDIRFRIGDGHGR